MNEFYEILYCVEVEHRKEKNPYPIFLLIVAT